jgi:hypothetical protein
MRLSFIAKTPGIFALFFASIIVESKGTDFSLSWPTPNASFAKGLGYHAFLQKTGPDKDFSSGAFGCVRNNGYKFHEGLDLFPVKSNSQGKAEDSIFAAMDGMVTYLSHKASDSAYGKYIVLEHTQFNPIIYSLYAHLDEISPNLSVGKMVQVAEPIGQMGNTASFRIPLDRSHLHFEVGIRLSNQFDKWYKRQRFKTPNKHNNYNGYNLVGIDPIKFYSEYQKKSFRTPAEFFRNLPTVAKVQVMSPKTPFLASRSSALMPNPPTPKLIKSWICSFGPFGLPTRLEPSASSFDGTIRILSYDEKHDSDFCRKLMVRKHGKLHPSEQLETYLELIFLD